MYDNEYNLDQILFEARKLRGQKRPEQGDKVNEQRRQSPAAGAPPRENPVSAVSPSYEGYAARPAAIHNTAQAVHGSYARPEEFASYGRSNNEPQAYAPPEPQPEPPRGFRMSRESAVFGQYQAPSAPEQPGHGERTRPELSAEYERPQHPAPTPRKAQSSGRADDINAEYAALRARYEAQEPPLSRASYDSARREQDGREDRVPRRQSWDEYTAARQPQDAPVYRQEYTRPERDAEPAPYIPKIQYTEPEEYTQPEHYASPVQDTRREQYEQPVQYDQPVEEALPPPVQPTEQPRAGFVLRRTPRSPEPLPPVAEPEYVPPAPAFEETRQFDTASLEQEQPGAAQEISQPSQGSPGSRWQAYRMLGQEEGDEGGWTEDGEDEQDENDLNRPEDMQQVRRLLGRHLIVSAVRLGVLTLTGGASIYLVLATIATVLPIPESFHPQQAPGMFALVLFILSLVSFAVCLPSIGGGLVSLVKLKADGNSMPAVASLSTMLYTLAFAISPALFANQNAQMYCAVAITGLWFYAAGKLMAAKRTVHNLSVIGSGEQLFAVRVLEGEGLAEEMAPLLADGHPKIAALQPAGFLKGLLHHSGASVQEKGISRILSPICVGAAAVLAASSYFLYRDVLTCFTVFTAVVCVCSPFTVLFGENLPLLRASRSLTAQGGLIAGGEAAETVADATAVVVDAAQLFNSGGITLHGIRTFKGGRIDVSILAAASVMEKIGGTMSEVFFHIIEGRTEILEDVDDVVYEEGMGLSAWVDGQHVLIGNRELMRHHGIELPPREYEQKYRQEQRHILYLSAGGELSSMFVISYNATDAVYEKIKRLERAGVTLIVHSTDPNITREMLTELFEVDYDLIQIMPPHLHGVYAQQTAAADTAEAQAATMGGALSLLDTFAVAGKIRAAGALSSVAQTLFMIAGYAVTTIITFFFGISLINPLLLLSYQLVAALITMVTLSLRRY